MTISLLLLIFAAVAFFGAAIGLGTGRFNLVAVGLLLWVIAVMVGSVPIS